MTNKLMTKALVIFAAASMALSAASVTAFANDGTDTIDFSVSEYSAVKYICCDGVNVRTEPSTNGRILAALDCNAKVTVDGKTNNGWVRIWTNDPVYGGQCSGYIRADLVSDAPVTVVSASTQNTSGYRTSAASHEGIKYAQNYLTVGGTYTVSVAKNYLALRSNPDYNYYNELAELTNGTQVIVQQNNGTYAYVYVPSLGMSGYVNANYLV